MVYYILYPKDVKRLSVRLDTKRPNPRKESKLYGFAEGPFNNIKEVKRRLKMMNIPLNAWPLNTSKTDRLKP